MSLIVRWQGCPHNELLFSADCRVLIGTPGGALDQKNREEITECCMCGGGVRESVEPDEYHWKHKFGRYAQQHQMSHLF